MDPAIQDVLQALTEQGAVPAGPMMCRHFARPETHFDLHLGFPVESGRRFEDIGRVRFGELPATRLLRTTYTGPYEGLADGWRMFSEWGSTWLASHPEVQLTGRFRESYLTDPTAQKDPNRWETSLELELSEVTGN